MVRVFGTAWKLKHRTNTTVTADGRLGRRPQHCLSVMLMEPAHNLLLRIYVRWKSSHVCSFVFAGYKYERWPAWHDRSTEMVFRAASHHYGDRSSSSSRRRRSHSISSVNGVNQTLRSWRHAKPSQMALASTHFQLCINQLVYSRLFSMNWNQSRSYAALSFSKKANTTDVTCMRMKGKGGPRSRWPSMCFTILGDVRLWQWTSCLRSCHWRIVRRTHSTSMCGEWYNCTYNTIMLLLY